MSDMLKTQDFVFIRAEDLQDMRAELKALRAENDALRAQWESVPWEAIKRMLGDIGCAERATLNSTMDDFSDVLNWWIANAPKPEAAE